jgi:tetratricopeptide (TPR) repeat protein
MSSQIASWLALIGTAATIPLVQTVAVAKSAVEVQQIAKQVTVQISGCGFGSGVILRKEGNTYTVLTVAHAVKKSGCQVTAPDDRKYPVANIKTFPNKVDLAVFTFTSSKTYPVAKLIANSDTVEAGETVYVSGYPVSTAIANSTFLFIKGDVAGNGTKQQEKGYSLIYTNNTLPGHSGGPVWNDKGEVIAIHGLGDVDTKLEQTMNDTVRVKTGFNLGITINTFTKLATSAGIAGYAPVTVAVKPKPVDDLIASAVAKESKGDYRGILADMDRAISLDSQQARLYHLRAIAKSKLDDTPGALADYSRAIQLDPNLADAYNNRGVLKKDKLNDTPGALADYNRAIQLAPNLADAYNNRGVLKYEKLNDTPGALADYNRAIQLAPNLAAAYTNRGNLKKDKLNDTPGALADYNRAIQLAPNLADAYNNRGNLKKDKLNDTPGALADYNRAIQLAPNLALAYINRGVLKYKNGDLSGAIFDYEKAVAIDPKNATSHSNIAFIKYDRGNIAGAIESWRKSLALSTDPDAQLGLAVALYKRGQEAEAYKLGAAAIRAEKRSIDLNFLKKERAWSEIILKDAVKFLQTPTMRSITR